MTDLIIFFCALFLFWRGWDKGFAQTVLGPAALIIGTFLSYFYYLIFHNLVIATAIGIVCPIILSIIFSMTLGVIFLGNDKKHISIISRFCGAVINTFWGEFLILTGLLLIILIPLQLPLIVQAQNNIKQSYTYAYINTWVEQEFHFNIENDLDPSKLSVLTDPKALESLGKTKEFSEVLQDPLVQDLLNDPEASQAIEQKNIGKLLQNPKFIALTKDPAIYKKFLALYGKILTKDKSANTTVATDLKPAFNNK